MDFDVVVVSVVEMGVVQVVDVVFVRVGLPTCSKDRMLGFKEHSQIRAQVESKLESEWCSSD